MLTSKIGDDVTTKSRRTAFISAGIIASLIWFAGLAVVLVGGPNGFGLAWLGLGVWGAAVISAGAVLYARRVWNAAARHDELDRLHDRIEEGLAAIHDDLRANRRSIDAAIEQTDSAKDRTAVALEGTLAELGDLHGQVRQLRSSQLPELRVDLRRHVSTTGRNDYEQFVAWTELRELLEIETPMPALRGWAASPDVIRFLVRDILARKPRLVVECGSGASSIWLGLALRRHGGRLVSLEHDQAYAQMSTEMVTAYGLAETVDVRFAPLTDFAVAGKSGTSAGQPWYDLAAVRDLSGIDLLFVDGPPGDVAPESRYPALAALLEACSADVMIVLDDADRPEERSTVARWIEEHPELFARSVPAEKGAAVLERRRVPADQGTPSA